MALVKHSHRPWWLLPQVCNCSRTWRPEASPDRVRVQASLPVGRTALPCSCTSAATFLQQHSRLWGLLPIKLLEGPLRTAALCHLLVALAHRCSLRHPAAQSMMPGLQVCQPWRYKQGAQLHRGASQLGLPWLHPSQGNAVAAMTRPCHLMQTPRLAQWPALLQPVWASPVRFQPENSRNQV